MKLRTTILGSALTAAMVLAAGGASAVTTIDLGVLSIDASTRTGSLADSTTVVYNASAATPNLAYGFVQGTVHTKTSAPGNGGLSDVLYEFTLAQPVEVLYGQVINSFVSNNKALGSGTLQILDVTTGDTALTTKVNIAGGGDPLLGSTFGQALTLTDTGDTYAVEVIGQIPARTLGTRTVPSNNFDVEYSTSVFAQAVPEPATWAVMFLGFGAIGATMRSARRRQVAVAA